MERERVSFSKADVREFQRKYDLMRQEISTLERHLATAEQRERDLTKDRDHWKARALELDARVKSLGGQP